MSTEKSPENYNSGAPGPVKLTVAPTYAGLRLAQALAKLLPEFSRSRLAQWVRLSRATVNGRAVLPRQRVWGGEVIHIAPVPDAAAAADRPGHISRVAV